MMTNENMTNEEIKKIAEAHWNYVNDVIKAHEEVRRLNYTEQQMTKEAIRLCKFHYITAFIHGWKHGIEERGEKKEIKKEEETIEALSTQDKIDSLLGYR